MYPARREDATAAFSQLKSLTHHRPISTPLLAAGTFGRVLECWDRRRKEYVAVKIVRNVDKYRHAAMIEVGGLPAATGYLGCGGLPVGAPSHQLC